MHSGERVPRLTRNKKNLPVSAFRTAERNRFSSAFFSLLPRSHVREETVPPPPPPLLLRKGACVSLCVRMGVWECVRWSVPHFWPDRSRGEEEEEEGGGKIPLCGPPGAIREQRRREKKREIKGKYRFAKLQDKKYIFITLTISLHIGQKVF